MEYNKKQEKLVDDLLNGKVILYSMSDIQKILSISRSTLNRWIKNGENRYFLDLGILKTPSNTQEQGDEEDTTTIFPEADLYIGNSPRWSKDTVKKWILESQKNK